MFWYSIYYKTYKPFFQRCPTSQSLPRKVLLGPMMRPELVSAAVVVGRWRIRQGVCGVSMLEWCVSMLMESFLFKTPTTLQLCLWHSSEWAAVAFWGGPPEGHPLHPQHAFLLRCGQCLLWYEPGCLLQGVHNWVQETVHVSWHYYYS